MTKECSHAVASSCPITMTPAMTRVHGYSCHTDHLEHIVTKHAKNVVTKNVV